MPAQKRTMMEELRDWDRLRTVLLLHREGTLSAAARALGVNHSTAARRLAATEAAFGAPLFERDPDGYRATPLGEEVIATAGRVAEEVDGLRRRIGGLADEITGTVRLTTTPHLAATLVAPALPGFHAAEPGICIELIGRSTVLDLSRREADLALRLTRSDLPGLVVRKLGDIAFALYAAADDRRPLEEQSVLAYDEADGEILVQRYLSGLAPPERTVLRSNNVEALTDCARAGMGCAVLSCFNAERDPALRRVPVPRAMAPLPLWVHYHEDLRRSPRLRRMVDFLEELVRGNRKRLVPEGFPFDPV